MKKITVFQFDKKPYVDLEQVRKIIQGYQEDINVLEAQLHSEIVGREQMVVYYESQIEEILLTLKDEIKGLKDILLPLRCMDSDYKLDRIEDTLKTFSKI